MKTILIPTDFSAISENAVDYAAEIAKADNAEIVLLHVYQAPFVTPEVPSMVTSINDIEESCVKELIKLRSRIHLQHGPHIKVEYAYRCGYAVEEIDRVAKELHPDLIVMGMRGAGYLEKKLIGSVTTSLIEKTKYPVLIINKGIKFNGLKKIVFAYDYLPLENQKTLEPVKNLSKLFDAHVYVLNVVREPVLVPNVKEAVAGVRLDHLLEEINHSFHFVEDENVLAGLNGFIEERRIDLMVILPHKHSFMNKLFNETHTSQVAFGAKTPILAIPE